MSAQKMSLLQNIVSFIGLFWKQDLWFYFTHLTLHNPQAVYAPNATVRRQNTLAKVCRSASLPICVRKSSAGCYRGACILYRKTRINVFQPENSRSAFLPISLRKLSAGCSRGTYILYGKIWINRFRLDNSRSALLPICVWKSLAISLLAVVRVRFF